MTRTILLALALALALVSARAHADVTVVYAPAAPPAPLVARPVGPTERSETPPPPSQPPPSTTATRVAAPVPVLPDPEPAVPAPAPPDPEPAALIAPCTTPRPITILRAGSDERAQLALTDCQGRADAASLVELSLLARPRTLAARPSARDLAEHAADREWIAAGVRRLHPGLAERLRALADRFPGHAIEIVSGFRPDAREGSRHLFGVALDVRVEGASLDAVHAFVRRFERTGVGLVRAEGAVHLDVRPRSVHWIDESTPGGPARIVEDDAARRGAIVRAPEPAPADAPIDEAALDADGLADEVLRGLGELSLPSGPTR